MTQLKGKLKIPLMVILVLTFAITGLTLAKPGYEILSYKGKIKVKKNNEMIPLIKHDGIRLEKRDIVMVYPGSSIEISFPGNSRKVFEGPFYAPVAALTQPFDKKNLSFFENRKIRKGIEGIFDTEGNASSGSTRSQNSVEFFNEVKKTLTQAVLEDKTPAAGRAKKMETHLESVKHMFSAFPEVKQILVRALVYKDFGQDKKALTTILSHYKKILRAKDKKTERELMEDYMTNRFLPIVIMIRSGDENISPGNVRSNKKNNGIKMIFSSNIKLWWAAFYYDGKTLKEIKKTIDYSQKPQNKFELEINITAKANMKKSRSRYLFIVTSPDWTQLDKFDSSEAAEKELLGNNIKETRSKRIQDYGEVIIKLPLGEGTLYAAQPHGEGTLYAAQPHGMGTLYAAQPHGMGDLYAAQPHGMGDLYAAQTVCVSFHSFNCRGAYTGLPGLK